jgi:hypothetical protein
MPKMFAACIDKAFHCSTEHSKGSVGPQHIVIVSTGQIVTTSLSVWFNGKACRTSSHKSTRARERSTQVRRDAWRIDVRRFSLTMLCRWSGRKDTLSLHDVVPDNIPHWTAQQCLQNTTRYKYNVATYVCIGITQLPLSNITQVRTLPQIWHTYARSPAK